MRNVILVLVSGCLLASANCFGSLDDEFVYSITLNSSAETILNDNQAVGVEDASGWKFAFQGALSGAPRGFNNTIFAFKDDTLASITMSLFPETGYFDSYTEQRNWVKELAEIIVKNASRKYKSEEPKTDWIDCDILSSCRSTITFSGSVKSFSVTYRQNKVYYLKDQLDEKSTRKKTLDELCTNLLGLESYVYSSLSVSYNSSGSEIPKALINEAFTYVDTTHFSSASYFSRLKYYDWRTRFTARNGNVLKRDRDYCQFHRVPESIPGTFDSGGTLWKLSPQKISRAIRFQ